MFADFFDKFADFVLPFADEGPVFFLLGQEDAGFVLFRGEASF